MPVDLLSVVSFMLLALCLLYHFSISSRYRQLSFRGILSQLHNTEIEFQSPIPITYPHLCKFPKEIPISTAAPAHHSSVSLPPNA